MTSSDSNHSCGTTASQPESENQLQPEQNARRELRSNSHMPVTCGLRARTASGRQLFPSEWTSSWSCPCFGRGGREVCVRKRRNKARVRKCVKATPELSAAGGRWVRRAPRTARGVMISAWVTNVIVLVAASQWPGLSVLVNIYGYNALFQPERSGDGHWMHGTDEFVVGLYSQQGQQFQTFSMFWSLRFGLLRSNLGFLKLNYFGFQPLTTDSEVSACSQHSAFMSPSDCFLLKSSHVLFQACGWPCF